MERMISGRKSTYSGGGGGNCVRVGHGDRAARVLVQDTKEDRSAARTTLTVTPDAWNAFVGSLR